jgi:hypothetical protein
VFDENVRAAYTEVRSCRTTGEHAGLGAYSVWASPEAAGAFPEIWQTPPAITRMPAGSVVVKEIYKDVNCVPDQVLRWVAMRKEPGFDPDAADWHWQEVDAPSNVLMDGSPPDCIGCHQGTASCTGYGDAAGRDYLCTVP